MVFHRPVCIYLPLLLVTEVKVSEVKLEEERS